MTAIRFEKTVIALVTLHSVFLGVAMLFNPEWTLATFRWPYDGSMFFASQSGVFLLVLGFAYGMGLSSRPFAWFIVGTKTVAVVFLLTEYAMDRAPIMAIAAATLDGLMGAGVALGLLLTRPAVPMPAQPAGN